MVNGEAICLYLMCVPFAGCVGGCDQVLQELIEICGTGTRSTTGMLFLFDTTIVEWRTQQQSLVELEHIQINCKILCTSVLL